MIQRVLISKNFLAMLLATVKGTLLLFKLPWPMTGALVPPTWNEYFSLGLQAISQPEKALEKAAIGSIKLLKLDSKCSDRLLAPRGFDGTNENTIPRVCLPSKAGRD
jgi:hypothetical protein